MTRAWVFTASEKWLKPWVAWQKAYLTGDGSDGIELTSVGASLPVEDVVAEDLFP